MEGYPGAGSRRRLRSAAGKHRRHRPALPWPGSSAHAERTRQAHAPERRENRADRLHHRFKQLYSGSDHSRNKSLVQRTNSLLVDLHDKPPTPSDTKDIGAALQETAANPEEFLALLIDADEANSIKPADGNTDQWITDTYLRFLQRPPSADELGDVREKVGGDGWRKVILGLTLKRDYSTY